jgi:rhamnosyltransferase
MDTAKIVCNLRQMLFYADTVVLFGNSKIPQELQFDDRIICFNNKTNIGISRSINKAALYAKKCNLVYAILFDQDSLLTHDDFQMLFSELRHEEQFHPVICIGPRLRNYNDNSIISCGTKNLIKVSSAKICSVNTIITSGMIVNIDSFLKIGGFPENYPLDFCDFLFCWTAIRSKFIVLQSNDVFMSHTIGERRISLFMQKIHLHPAYRHYFLVRDTLNISIKEKVTPFYTRCRLLFLLPFRMLVYWFVLPGRTLRIKMYVLGFRDFFLGKRGFGSVANLLDAQDSH